MHVSMVHVFVRECTCACVSTCVLFKSFEFIANISNQDQRPILSSLEEAGSLSPRPSPGRWRGPWGAVPTTPTDLSLRHAHVSPSYSGTGSQRTAGRRANHISNFASSKKVLRSKTKNGPALGAEQLACFQCRPARPSGVRLRLGLQAPERVPLLGLHLESVLRRLSFSSIFSGLSYLSPFEKMCCKLIR